MSVVTHVNFHQLAVKATSSKIPQEPRWAQSCTVAKIVSYMILPNVVPSFLSGTGGCPIYTTQSSTLTAIRSLFLEVETIINYLLVITFDVFTL